MTVYEYGVDLDSSLTFKDGDLRLAEYDTNIVQAIGNRLNTIQDALDLFYEDYGSLFLTFLGWRKTPTTLDFMKIELDRTLQQDPRIDEFTTELSFGDDGSVMIQIIIESLGEDLTANFVLGVNGVELIETEEM